MAISACGSGSSGGASVGTTPAAKLKPITIDPVLPSIAKGTSVRLTATGNYSNGTTKDLSNSVVWASSDATIAKISTAGDSEVVVTGIGVGGATITAALASVEGTTTVTVTAAVLTAITITPINPSIANGTSVQSTATGNFSDGTTEDLTNLASWTSSDDTVAEAGNAADTKGLVTGLAVGTALITATFNGVQGATTATVTSAILASITIDPADPSIANGTSVQLTATGNFSDGTTEDLTNLASWTSSDGTVAEVSNAVGSKGLATGLAVGTASITATFNGVQGATTVTVTSAILTSITVDPADPSIAAGTGVQLTATGNFSDGTTENLTEFASWTSSNNSIAQVSNADGSKGLVTGITPGAALITATLDGVQGSTTVTVTAAILSSITVEPADPSIAKGTGLQLTATGNFSDGTTEDLTALVSWTSSNDAIAQVGDAPGSKGLVSGLAVGSAAITATLAGVQGSTTATITPAVLTSITIDPVDPSIAKGTSVQLTATGNFSDGTTEDLTAQVSWTSSDSNTAQVSNAADSKGLVTGLATGVAVITATIDGVQGSTTVTVTSAVLTSITITPVNPTIAAGTSVQLTATGNFSDGTTEDITELASWTSSNTLVAQVSNEPGSKGLVTGLAVGVAVITVTYDGVQGSASPSFTPL